MITTLTVAAVGYSAVARADIRVCNHSGEKIWMVMAYLPEGSDRWATSGWYAYNNDECANIWSGPPTNTRYYFHAQGESGRQYGGPNTFCVVPGLAFTLHNADDLSRCAEPRSFFCRWVVDAPNEEIVITSGFAGLHESRCDI